MDLVRLPALRQISLRLSAEGNRVLYLAQDCATGRIFTLPARIAHAVRTCHYAAFDPQAQEQARAVLEESMVRDAYGLLHMIRSARSSELLQRKTFNPLFMNFPLFDVGPYQAWLQPLARFLVGWKSVIALMLLALFCVTLCVRNDWAILDAFNNLFSLQAILSFGLMGPFLKIIHEFGHVLVATHYGVRVRKAGIMMIGLYPMPFVDCTDADLSARRRHRIAISLAGVATDMMVGGVAFVAWHFTEGDFLHVLLAHIFVFSTLNSILFNVNPLAKLDGYFALTDALRARNFYTRSHSVFKDLRLWIASFGRLGALPHNWQCCGMAFYAFASVFYRIHIVWAVAYRMMPQYLGVGALLTGWGALVMFGLPLMQDKPADPGPNKLGKGTLWGWRLATFFVTVAAFFFVRWPFVVVVPVSLDFKGTYQVATQGTGYLKKRANYGMLKAGDTMTKQENPIWRDERIMLDEQMDGAKLVYDSFRGQNQAKASAAKDKIASLTKRQKIVEQELANLTHVAPSEGLFIPFGPMIRDSWLPSGHTLGAFLPNHGAAVFTGAFPERYVSLFQQSVRNASLKIGTDFVSISPKILKLRDVVMRNKESGVRSWQLYFRDDKMRPLEVAGRPGDLRLAFKNAPLWQHALFWWQGLVTKYRESELQDRAHLLD